MKNKGNPGKEDGKEMLRAAVSLERIEVDEKVALAKTMLDGFTAQREELWLLARLGARNPLDPDAHSQVIPSQDMSEILDVILSNSWEKTSFGPQALVNMAQKCGDPKRDLSPELFEKVEQAFLKAEVEEKLLARLRGEVQRTQEEAAALYGDSLPLGLRLAD